MLPQNVKWLKYGKWTTPLLLDSIISEALSKPYFSDFGYSHKFNNFLAIDSEYYVDETEHKKACNFFEGVWGAEGSKFLCKFYALSNPETEKALTWISRLQKIVVKNLDNKQLLLEFKNWIAAMQPVMYLSALFIPFQEVIERIAKDAVAQFVKNDASLFLTRVTQPKSLSHVIKEGYDLLEISCVICESKALAKKLLLAADNHFDLIQQHEPMIAKMILEHTDKYAWLSTVDWMGSVFDVDYFLSRIINFLTQNPQRILDNRKKGMKEKELLIKKRLKEVKMPYSAVFIIDTLRSLLDLKQELWDTVSILGYRAREMLTEIGERLGLTYNELLQLTSIEIENSLISKQQVPKLGERLRNRAILRLGSHIRLFYGSEASKLTSLLFKEGKSEANILRGSPCFQGFARGNVRIISTIRELSKMENGKILVCPMTNPDYMPAICKAAAIITDEGGILCHAAIISRELKIPCVVGTKNATKVLKDEDLVDVYADKGIVKIVKRA